MEGEEKWENRALGEICGSGVREDGGEEREDRGGRVVREVGLGDLSTLSLT